MHGHGMECQFCILEMLNTRISFYLELYLDNFLKTVMRLKADFIKCSYNVFTDRKGLGCVRPVFGL